LFWLDVDHFGIAWAEPAQFIAYQFRVGFLFEERLPCVVGTPPVVTAVIPAEGFRVGPGSKGDTVGHRLLPLRGWSHRVHALAGRSISPIVGIKPVGDQKRQARAGLRAADCDRSIGRMFRAIMAPVVIEGSRGWSHSREQSPLKPFLRHCGPPGWGLRPSSVKITYIWLLPM
jgi:hypothetical protein